MKNITQIVGALVLTVLAVVIGISIENKISPDVKPIGSVAIANEYKATTTSSLTANVALAAAGRFQLQVGESTVGSVVVASTTASIITFKNATSTADVASTTVFTLPASLPAGTYTFDITGFPRGLAVDLPASFFGNYIITFR